MSTEPVQLILWSEEKLQRLQAQLTGIWAEDAWPLFIYTGQTAKKKQVFLRFDEMTSPWLKVEFKYALWKRLAGDQRKLEGSQNRLYYSLPHLVQWLNRVAPSARSLLEQSPEFWTMSLRSYLVEMNIFRPEHTKSLRTNQAYHEYETLDKRIQIFRVVYRIIAEVYDDRPETEKDIWDVRKLGLALDFTQSTYLLNFSLIIQPWLRQLAKEYMKYRIALRAPADCFAKLTGLRHFSRFLAKCFPGSSVRDIDRALILKYISILQAQNLRVSARNKYLISLRIFLETCVHQMHVPGLTRERLIFEEDLAKIPEYVSREVPEEVFVQLRQHLETLPTTLLRMVVILMECGMRISELCTLPLDCLICDDKHEWYLRFYLWKSKKEQVIPLVDKEVIGAIQAQQQEIRAKFGNTYAYLFPSVSSHLKPYHQSTFRDQLNGWALKHEIKGQNQQLYRFTAHQFRHSLGMRLINDDIPIEVVSRLLGHNSLNMTQVYARVRDKKVRADLERVARKRKTVDYQGNAIKGDSRANDPEAQMTRKGIRGQTLPVGGCNRLVVLGDCNYANKCLTCPMWLTSTDDLPALKSFYERAIRLKQRAASVGNQIVINQQDHIIPLLAVRIKSLEATEMDGSLCVDDVLASLRSDLAEAESGLEEAREAGLILAAKHLERAISEIKARILALEEPA